MAWSHGFGSGRLSKDSLENTEWKSQRYSGMCFFNANGSEFFQKASANLCEMVEVALMYSACGGSLEAQIQSPSSMM